MAFTTLPEEVLERIFAQLNFPRGTKLSGPRLWDSESNRAAMCLALCSRTTLKTFASTISTVSMDVRNHFGNGMDEQVATLIAIVGPNLKRLVLDAVGKQVGPRTCRAIRMHCPNITSLYLADLPSVTSRDLALIVACTGKNLSTLWLRGVYAGDDVLESIAQHCTALTELRLVDLESDVSAAPLERALLRVTPTVSALYLANVAGRGLSSSALARACTQEWPVLTTLHFIGLEWLAEPETVSLLISLGDHAPKLSNLLLSLRSLQTSPLFTESQIREIRGHLKGFTSRQDGGYAIEAVGEYD
jgi:hypothetical protein